METLVVLRTAHKGGVLHLTFSTDGRKLISIGMDRTFSIQIFRWRQQRSIAFRNTGYYPIFGIRFNPYDDSCFYTCGYQHLAEWRIKGSHLTCAKFVNIYNTSVPPASGEGINNVPVSDSEQKQYFMNQKNILTCIDFISFRQGHSIQSDVVFGNNLGDISTYCNSKYFVLFEQAHPGVPINCIRVTNALSLDRQSCMVVTGGEDGLVKIWNASIQLKQMIDLRQSVDIQDLKNIKSYGI
jgi:WD40 repeat protein